MNLHTEKEFINNSAYFSYKLKKTYLNNPILFKEIASFSPNLIYITKEDSLNVKDTIYLYHNNNNILIKSPELQELAVVGASMLPKISCPILLNNLTLKIKGFKQEKDFDIGVRYFQQLRINGKKTYTLTNKFFLDKENTFLNLSDRVEDMPLIGKFFNDVFQYYHQDYITWQRYLSLTKQEKKIIKLLVDGLTNNQVANCLFISIETVKTHKKNIYKKLNINTAVALVKVAFILELE